GGGVEDAGRAAEAGLAVAAASELAPVVALNRHVLGFLELSLGNLSAAHDRLAPLAGAVAAMGFEEPAALRFLPDAAEALIGVGELVQAGGPPAPFQRGPRAPAGR